MRDLLPELDTNHVVNTISDELTRMVVEKLVKQDVLAPVVHAKFIIGDDGFVRCSACNKTIRYPLVSFSAIEYCPRCGAKIDT